MAAEHGAGGLVHLTSSPLDWYVARAAGVAAYLLITISVGIGITMAGKKTLRRWPRFVLEDVHRFVGLIAGAFITIHVVAIAIDAWLPFSISSILVPLLSRYRPLWVAAGIVAAELLLALAITNHYRRRLPYRFWRRAHYVNFVVWSAATLHGVGSGTDRSSLWALSLYAVSTAAVGAACVWRLAHGRLVRRQLLGVAGAAAAATAAAVVTLGAGPVRFTPKPWNAATFREPLTGHIARLRGFTRAIVSLAGEGQGTQRVLVRADLLIAPSSVVKTSFQMEYLPSGLHCDGHVTKVHARAFNATCRLRTGEVRHISAQWDPSATSEISAGVIASDL
ncbi:MAG: ferric reductase-like transmembrane domain-containing protein [Gaiellaceae bacterium]